MYEWLSHIFHKNSESTETETGSHELPVVKEKFFDYGFTRITVRYDSKLGELTLVRQAMLPWRELSDRSTPRIAQNTVVIRQLFPDSKPDPDFLKALENSALNLVQTGGNFDVTYKPTAV